MKQGFQQEIKEIFDLATQNQHRVEKHISYIHQQISNCKSNSDVDIQRLLINIGSIEKTNRGHQDNKSHLQRTLGEVPYIINLQPEINQNPMIISDLIEAKASQLGVHADILKTAAALSLTLLLSPVFHLLGSKSARTVFNLTVGILLLCFILQDLLLYFLLSVAAPYLLISALPRPFLVSAVYSFGVLLYTHCHRFMFEYKQWRVDLSTYLMLFVIKLTYFAKWVQHSEQRRKQASFLDYLSYNLFFPTLIAGPSFSYELYIDFINRDSSARYSLLKALWPLCLGVPISLLAIYTMPIFPSTWFLQSSFYLGLSLWQKALITIPVGFIYRTKFYGAWYLAQTSTNLSGISLTADGEYTAVTAVSIMFEIEPNPKLKTEYWHTGTQEWLRVVVYDALAKRMSSTPALFATFLISAFWHGVYLIYYVGFFLWAMLQHITKWAYKWSGAIPKRITEALVFKAAVWLAATLLMNMIGIVIVILEWKDALRFYADIYYWPLFAFLVLTLLTFAIRPPNNKFKKQ